MVTRFNGKVYSLIDIGGGILTADGRTPPRVSSPCSWTVTNYSREFVHEGTTSFAALGGTLRLYEDRVT